MRFQTDRHYVAQSAQEAALSFRPTQLPGLVLWVRADQGVTGTTEVTAVTDLSGAGNNLAKGTTGPALTASVAALGGKPAFTFDGTGKWLFKDPLIGVVAQPNTIAVALNMTDNAVSRQALDGNGGNRQFIIANATLYSFFAGTQLDKAATTLGPHAIICVGNGASSIVGVDGSELTGAAGSGSLGACYLGANFLGGVNWKGDIADVMVYNRLLSITERAAVRAYMKARYATP